jgi:hypothetical protein
MSNEFDNFRTCLGCGELFDENTDHEYCSPECFESLHTITKEYEGLVFNEDQWAQYWDDLLDEEKDDHD